MCIFSVLPIGPFDNSYFYLSEEKLQIGDVVEVPFGRRSVIGVVFDKNSSTDMKLKTVQKTFNFNIGKINCDFLKWVADYTLIPKGNVLKMMLSEKTILTAKKNNVCPPSASCSFNEIKLNENQSIAYKKIIDNNKINANAKPFLLNGVTGSGKTEIYLAVIKDILLQKKQVLILLPEIALTQQILKRIEKYFGFSPIIWNSSMTQKNKRTAWLKIISGEPYIVVGARSALFIPFKNLGIIIVDEEHDSSYKQEERGFYNARDMAVARGHVQKIPVILSSATPSLESYTNAKSGKYGYAFIENRFGSSKMPLVNLIDMKQNKFDGFVSPILLNKIKFTIQNGEQCLIYLNRRGYSPITLCRSCGEKVLCPNCSVSLVYHKNLCKLICHYCGHKTDMPKKCNFCDSEDSHILFGPGVERIFDELKRKLTTARIEVVSSDTILSDSEKLFDKIMNNDVDIIIGTQILTKGHHFPNITLVGVIDGDLGLNEADMRASEKTFQLINQVAGRAGREEKQGEIFIQTFNPNHSLYAALKSGDSENFIKLETESRKSSCLPPFSKLASIIISGTNKELTEKVAKDLSMTQPKDIDVFGPAPAPIFFLRGRTRWRFLLRSSKERLLNNAIKHWIPSKKLPKNIKIQIDIDPISFL